MVSKLFTTFAIVAILVTKGWYCDEKSQKESDCGYPPNFCWEDDNINKPETSTKQDLDPDTIWWSVPITDAYNNDEAYCLDGSMPHYYFRPGFVDETNNNDGTNKYYLYLQGGGWCAGVGTEVASCMDTCDHRATTNLGSTNGDAPTMTNNGGYFSQTQSGNPVMYNWNSMYLRYCDGASYTGDNSEPVPVGNSYIYYRGHRILRGVIDSILDNNTLATPVEFVLLGCSAGGLGTFLNADWVNDYITSRGVTLQNYGAMPDSGYFMQYESQTNFQGGMEWVYTNQNSSVQDNEACTSQYSDMNEYSNCIFAQNIAGVTKVPLFPLQSIYDSWQIPNDLGNSNNATLINIYGNNLTTSFKEEVLSNPNNGCFLSSCSYHCGQWDAFDIDSYNMGQAMYDWYNGGTNDENNQFMQIDTYPCSSCCSN